MDRDPPRLQVLDDLFGQLTGHPEPQNRPWLVSTESVSRRALGVESLPDGVYPR
ncbi:BQ5605_C008g04935 [Microbotryum silenes-dioicae]|uniref:BQ5605_C008g04935 protein n=1 Tax=Microbotryum silenes-dioicae TaxID=796604 RepID=A0A2X0MYN8_9BASI|nr:BQ5605_C008g04935 [Microbotryum silenes-dioicae]